ncbi:2Fe-2S iron-sulfur cluster binding domain-containing protein [Pedobacter sp. HMF7647]|uniref:2Fe-2S iron-sulfur cluster binding domain-containing protein n=1 Tax=Hufsiella arboris TaxID=2695275 RepID=A0A7K1Y985_9SPHI|nr:iron-sulfur cluster-binding domain-containing protein [Hufsiella arboris]MXV50598.1 2Fe-2S iron-sulfur cluster binding domain-containing protein [Hufsiella arboris]
MEETIRFTINEVINETADAKSYLLKTDDQPDFLPGQFLTFLVSVNNKEYRRSYSIVTLPGEQLKIIVKRVENGVVSRYIFDNWHKGSALTALPPSGRFTLQTQSSIQRDIYFIIAGSGITPAIPHIRNLLINERQSALHLIYSNHNEHSTIFLAEIKRLDDEYENLFVEFLFSDPNLHFEQRKRLNNGLLEKMIGKSLKYRHENAVFMLCGPFTFMRMAKITAIFMGFHADQIKTEHFIPEILYSGTHQTPVYSDRTVSIIYKNRRYRVSVTKNQSILRAARLQNLELPYSCEGGICATCMAKCISGKVDMTINEVLTPKDLQKGLVLTCTGHPMTDDVLIDFDTTDQ